MEERKYISKLGKEYELSFKIIKDISDKESHLYRFQIYIGDNAFGCDFTISDYKVKKYELTETEIINICFDLIQKILDKHVEEYSSIRVGEENIIDFLAAYNKFERINKINN